LGDQSPPVPTVVAPMKLHQSRLFVDENTFLSGEGGLVHLQTLPPVGRGSPLRTPHPRRHCPHAFDARTVQYPELAVISVSHRPVVTVHVRARKCDFIGKNGRQKTFRRHVCGIHVPPTVVSTPIGPPATSYDLSLCGLRCGHRNFHK